ncbi:MAG: cell separation during budding [Piccolia ochrophora]|nr:MAG: cell separation during budding [Piccolia ochrophora]
MADQRPVHPANNAPVLQNLASPIPTSKERPTSPFASGRSSHASSSSFSSSHRQSVTDTLRGLPPSPRERRQPSFSQAAVQELLDNPPPAKPSDPAFAGRDWKEVEIGELVDVNDVHFVELDTGVEATTSLLIDSGSPVVLIRETASEKRALATFDYSDLNAYLLLVVGIAHPDESEISSFNELAKKAREGNKIPIKDVKDLGNKEPFIALPNTARLTQAVEIFGSGVHRIIIVKEGTEEVTGILNQLRLVKFLWENGKSFPVIDHLYPQHLRDLNVGSHQVIAINGDRPLTDALELMSNEGVTSLAVVDNQLNVIGNISTADVKHLTRSSSLPLLRSSCIHFISVILSDRGINAGKDSFPVFHINPFSTLAHTIAKLVATSSHRMWVTSPPTPPSSVPSTPVSQPAVLVPPPSMSPPISSLSSGPPPFNLTTSPSVSASALPGAAMSGRLTGVISLTDILNLFARASGLSPTDPNETRERRRRSSSSSLQRPSLDSGRSSSIDIRR